MSWPPNPADANHVSDAFWSPDATTMAGLRAQAATVMDLTVSVQRRANSTPSATGGLTTGLTTVLATASCRIVPKTFTAPDESAPGKLVWVTLWLISFPYGTDVRQDDLITESVSGRAYQVQGVLSGRTLELTHRVSAVSVD